MKPFTRRFITLLIGILCQVSPIWGQPPQKVELRPHQARMNEHKSASKIVTCTYEAGSNNNSLNVRPFPGQQFALDHKNGATCAVMILSQGAENASWYVDVADEHWFDQVGDAILTIDYIAPPDLPFPLITLDSAFYSYHQVQDPILAEELKNEHGQVHRMNAQIDLGNNMFRNSYKIRKIRFGNHLPNHADFILNLQENPSQSANIGLCRMTLRLQSVSPKPFFIPITFRDLIPHFYQTILERQPTKKELAVLESEFRAGHLQLREFLRNLLKSWEYLQKNFFPLERTDAVRRLFRITCGRNPRISEINVTPFPAYDRNFHYPLMFFL